jgi:hypothetical protein
LLKGLKALRTCVTGLSCMLSVLQYSSCQLREGQCECRETWPCMKELLIGMLRHVGM